ncbi:putative transcription factor Hap3/NF-YB family [Medicago truncatula]|uniref:Nuclear transcription factor Y protein n=1 Tax=Medicago truncatula TaxID=3880 RepID=A0A072VG79_MEDTR|nr:nuclear transcription factor Y protein [Medicago truncatula]RHN77830.1 putative transcription factor Hap3/NF-YB family [Medicago truncatula]
MICLDGVHFEEGNSSTNIESQNTCLSEFTSSITSEASERCKIEHRKIITANDLIWAMDRLGFDDYVGPLVFYLQRYRNYEAQCNDVPIKFGFDKDGSSARGSNNGSDNVQG